MEAAWTSETFGNLPQHYTASEARRTGLDLKSPRYRFLLQHELC